MKGRGIFTGLIRYPSTSSAFFFFISTQFIALQFSYKTQTLPMERHNPQRPQVAMATSRLNGKWKLRTSHGHWVAGRIKLKPRILTFRETAHSYTSVDSRFIPGKTRAYWNWSRMEWRTRLKWCKLIITDRDRTSKKVNE